MKKIICLLIIISACTSQNPIEESGDFRILFCPHEDCMGFVNQKISQASELKCAVYNINSKEFVDIIKTKDHHIIVDKLNKYSLKGLKYNTNKGFQNLMHNKFCILDKKAVITGSFNFIENNPNSDNLIYIESSSLAENYLDEFEELSSRNFGSGKKVKNPEIYFNSILIENYFCPEDNCEQHLVDLINSAESSINFMAFAFTSNNVGDALNKKSSQGINVSGIFESSQLGTWSEEKRMKFQYLVDSKPYEMHHKVFIIDKKIVLTGSYNPTKSGTERNDENILIFHNEKIASFYLSEFNFLTESLKLN